MALRHVRTTAWLSEGLKISFRTYVSSAQSLRTQPGMSSGPGAFLSLVPSEESCPEIATTPGCWEAGI